MAIGCSMGGNLLANVMGTLGDESVIDAACVVEAPIKLDEVAKNLSQQLNGVYDKKLATYMKRCILREEKIFADYFQEHHGMDIIKALKEEVETIHDIDRVFTVKLYGYESPEQYYKKASSINQIPNIRRPTLFIAAVDDPIIGEGGIDKEVFKHNKHTVLATVKTGGHMGFYEDFFAMSSWVKKPALDYLNILRY